ncbi:sigma-70 family RNA polymerase sigma factor [Luteolibacter flavescens]|uniref:Sigma-70 family RNA polymerase sigma factor n=1 Tax=Luteolibacter flavescens TaxID=1859460 RepID=A0ABT3FUS0_9BACT|nr:sigma-70 family RNA polymerase sigma factor [Luteolibacter flavescens]MCW1887297.1 sigma-70 family RNA polymerase sigma factor [Luteolibacter flavescens]
MHAPSDAHLLSSWLDSDSEAGFRMLVERYSGLVFMTAKRAGADDSMAEEAAQLTFITLAKKASSLSSRDSLGGWLHITSRMQAKNLLQHRRREAIKLETLGVYLNTAPQGRPAEAWSRVMPVLDEALAGLSKNDREAILLRYYRTLSVREIAGILGITALAAQKRIDRAMERLRHQLSRHGVAAGTSLGALLLAGFASDVQAAAPLAGAFAERALKSAAAAGSPAAAAFLRSLLCKEAALTAVAVLALAAVTKVITRDGDAASSEIARNEAPLRQPSAATLGARPLSPAGEKRRVLEATYGIENTALSQAIVEQSIRISLTSQSLLTERVLPGIERHALLPEVAGLDLTPQQRREVRDLTIDHMKRLVSSRKETLEQIRTNPLPAMEFLLAGDACARGDLSMEDNFESLRASLGPELAALENPVDLETELVRLGTEDPLSDEAFMTGLRSVFSDDQYASFVAATQARLDARAADAVARHQFTSLAMMPPIELGRLAKRTDGSLLILECMTENLQASASPAED